MPHTDAGLDLDEDHHAYLEYKREIMEIDEKSAKDAIRCRCNKCGAFFDESELVTIQYAEYAGASMQDEYASPCCNAEWYYVDEKV